MKDPSITGPATIHYTDIGDYLTREEKLRKVAEAEGVAGLEPVIHITPNEHGDWLNQRRDDFEQFMLVADKRLPSIFGLHSSGVKTNRDSWAYNFSVDALCANMQSAVDFYNEQSTPSSDLVCFPPRALLIGTRRSTHGTVLTYPVSSVASDMRCMRPLFASLSIGPFHECTCISIAN